jgi:hypothetical protein
VRAPEIAGKLYAGLDMNAFAPAIDRDITVLSAAFRTAFDFPDQSVTAPELSPHIVIASSTELLLHGVSPSP